MAVVAQIASNSFSLSNAKTVPRSAKRSQAATIVRPRSVTGFERLCWASTNITLFLATRRSRASSVDASAIGSCTNASAVWLVLSDKNSRNYVLCQGTPSGVSLRACGPRKLMKMLSPLFSVRRNFYLAFSTLPQCSAPDDRRGL